MGQFLGDIAGMLEIIAIAAGLALLHRASKEAPARLLKAAGLLLVVGGIGVGLCTTFYWFKYQKAGGFDRVALCHASMASGAMSAGHMMPGKGAAPASAPAP